MGSSWQLIPKGFSIALFVVFAFLVCTGVEFNLGAELPFNSQWRSLYFAVTVALKTSGSILSSIVMHAKCKWEFYFEYNLHSFVILIPSCGTRALYLWRVDSVLCGLWGLISSTRDQTHVPYVGRQVVNSGPPGKSVIVF